MNDGGVGHWRAVATLSPPGILGYGIVCFFVSNPVSIIIQSGLITIIQLLLLPPLTVPLTPSFYGPAYVEAELRN